MAGGYIGIAAYLPKRKVAIVIENTNGPTTPPGRAISGSIFAELTKYLTPNNPISR